jgi:uncharacterized membrane protein
MLPRALIGDTKPENWIGLIDGVYAIVLTLLLIELPSFIIEFAKEYQAHPNEISGWLYSFLYIIIGYFAVFLIVYDVWAHHRVLLANAFISRFNFAVGAITLFLVSLFPPLTFVINDLRYEFMIGKLSPVGGAASVYWGARYAFYIILVCTYGSIALVSTKDLLAFQRLGGGGIFPNDGFTALEAFQHRDAVHHDADCLSRFEGLLGSAHSIGAGCSVYLSTRRQTDRQALPTVTASSGVKYQLFDSRRNQGDDSCV